MDQEKIRLRASRSDFSDRMLDGEPRHLNGLNQYLFSLSLYLDKDHFRVTSVEEAESRIPTSLRRGLARAISSPPSPLERLKDLLRAGVVDLPMVGSNVYACDESILKRVFCVREGVEIGPSLGTIQ